MERDTFDVGVIGGGATGAGIALDAASRGLSVALIEKGDFGIGTSSRSTKLIHGGLRYLERFEFRLVRESLAERTTLIETAPHLARPIPFLVPLYHDRSKSPLGTSKLRLGLGLWIYDRLARRQSVGGHAWLSADEALRLAPGLDPRGLRGAFRYYDCVTDDARLVIELAKTAADWGAAVANYVAARGFVHVDGRVAGVQVEDSLGGRKFALSARVIVNATGVWSDDIAAMDSSDYEKKLRPSKGIHIVVSAAKLGVKAAVLIPSLGERRFIFVMPWCGRTLIGTTDTQYEGNLDDPRADALEVSRLIVSTVASFPQTRLSTDDVLATFAGLRPLAQRGGKAATVKLSREELILESETGLISIIGGKLTTYRAMAERVVDRAAQSLARDRRANSAGRCVTRHVKLAGGPAYPDSRYSDNDDADLAASTVEHLKDRYGGNYGHVIEIIRDSPELAAPLVAELPNVEAEVVYATRSEMAATVEDVLARRTRISLLTLDGGRSCAGRVAELMNRYQGCAEGRSIERLPASNPVDKE